MNILHIIPSVADVRGGPSKAVIEMVRALRDSNINAEIATTNDNGAALLDVPMNTLSDYQGVPVRFFQRFSPSIHPIREFAFSSEFRVWLKQNIKRYDAIHIHAIFSFTSSYAMYLARKHNVPYVVRPIGQLENWSLKQSKARKHLFLTLFERKNLANASAIQFTADSEKRQALLALPELIETRTNIIPLGISPSPRISSANEKLLEHYKLSRNKKTLLYLSRLHPKKGLEILIESLSQVDTDTWQLIIAGDGEPEYVKSLKQFVSQAGLERHCHFIGFASGQDKDLLLQGSDLYVLTSYSENFGIAVLEALSAGTPVLISREVALSQAVETAKVGLVCELNTESITAALHPFLNDQSQINNDPAAYAIENYGWHSIAAQLTQMYSDITI